MIDVTSLTAAVESSLSINLASLATTRSKSPVFQQPLAKSPRQVGFRAFQALRGFPKALCLSNLAATLADPRD